MVWDFRSLDACDQARRLAAEVYRASAAFPERERSGAVRSMRQASISIPANIVEGCSRIRRHDALRFVRAALRSTEDLDYQLLMARDVELLNGSEYRDLSAAVREVRRALIGVLGEIKGRV